MKISAKCNFLIFQKVSNTSPRIVTYIGESKKQLAAVLEGPQNSADLEATDQSTVRPSEGLFGRGV